MEKLNVCIALTDGATMVEEKEVRLIGQLMSRAATISVICRKEFIWDDKLVLELDNYYYENVHLYHSPGATGLPVDNPKWKVEQYQRTGDKSPLGLCDVCILMCHDKNDICDAGGILDAAAAVFHKPVHIMYEEGDDVILCPNTTLHGINSLFARSSAPFQIQDYIEMLGSGNNYPKMGEYAAIKQDFDGDIIGQYPLD